MKINRPKLPTKDKVEQEVLEKYEALSKDEKRFIKLSWWLIERKIMYYYGDMIRKEFHEQFTASDGRYDEKEKEYLRLCVKLGKENTVAHHGYADVNDGEDVPGPGMQEVDFDRPCVKLVLSKYGVRNRKEQREAGEAIGQAESDTGERNRI